MLIEEGEGAEKGEVALGVRGLVEEVHAEDAYADVGDVAEFCMDPVMGTFPDALVSYEVRCVS